MEYLREKNVRLPETTRTRYPFAGLEVHERVFIPTVPGLTAHRMRQRLQAAVQHYRHSHDMKIRIYKDLEGRDGYWVHRTG
jgi:hypothetical protein